ncbi:hypothetical protein [Cryptosporangium sp. NPDC051539]|uniref:hypothetical protein n=1 Tax=Cryptosporangium sp. NPDC051539 TaxID=3363962 RepID=UPI0037A36CA8
MAPAPAVGSASVVEPASLAASAAEVPPLLAEPAPTALPSLARPSAARPTAARPSAAQLSAAQLPLAQSPGVQLSGVQLPVRESWDSGLAVVESLLGDPAPVADPDDTVEFAPLTPAAVAPRTPAGGGQPGLIIEWILRDREGLWREILLQSSLNSILRKMLLSSVVSLAVYGLVLGASAGPLQAISSGVKLPLLFLLTLAICLPTLYLFNLVFGARLSIRQALSLVLVSITVTGALTLAFAPISLFFLVTANDYEFFKLLNVAILMLTGFVGLSVMVDGMRGLNRLSGTPGPKPKGALDRPVNTRLLYVWVLLFGFVGTQLAWTLRPFIGEPNHPFQLFRDIEGSFYSNVLDTIASLLGG